MIKKTKLNRSFQEIWSDF